MWPFKRNDEKAEIAIEGLANLGKELRELRNDMLKLETDQHNLRGQFNRKLKGIAEFENKHGQAENPAAPQETKALNKTEPKVFSGMHGIVPE